MTTPVDLGSTSTSTSPRVGLLKVPALSSTCWRSPGCVVRWEYQSAELFRKQHCVKAKLSCSKELVHQCAGTRRKKLPHLLLHADGHVGRKEEDSFPWKRRGVQVSDHGTVMFRLKIGFIYVF